MRGSRISFRYRGKHRVWVRTAVVDEELAAAMKELLALPGGRSALSLPREDALCNLTGARLNEYIREHLGEEFTAKDFRTWGGTLLAAIALAEHGPAETETEAKRVVAGVMRAVGEKLGNTPAVARSSYVSPAVVEQYLDGRTIDDFRPRHLRVVGARDKGLDRGGARALLACCVRGEFAARALPRELSSPFRYAPRPFFLSGGNLMARKTVLVCDNCGREVGEGKGATLRLNYTDARRGSKQADLCDDCAGRCPATQLRGGAAGRSPSAQVPQQLEGGTA